MRKSHDNKVKKSIRRSPPRKSRAKLVRKSIRRSPPRKSRVKLVSNFRKYKMDEDIVSCCICEKLYERDATLVPLSCLQKYVSRAHRICQNCWWDPKTGFAREDAPHGCPGCKKGFPLTKPIKSKIPEIVQTFVIEDD